MDSWFFWSATLWSIGECVIAVFVSGHLLISKFWLFSTQNLGISITADGDCSHEIKRCLLLGRKVMTNLDRIFKSRDITLPTKVYLVKAIFQWSCMDVRVGL